MPLPYQRCAPIKAPIDPARIWRFPTQFAPINRRLVFDRHLDRLSLPQIALYLFLHCVADAQGLSYYSDPRIAERLHLSCEEVRQARDGLIAHRLLLYRHPLYQLLDLPGTAVPTPPTPEPRPRNGEPIPIAQVVQRLYPNAAS